MKKFCNKIKKQHWRVSVPIEGGIFKNPFNKNESSPNKRDSDVCVTGSYDLEEARKEYDKNYDTKTVHVVELDSSDSEDFEDATGLSENNIGSTFSTDEDLYMDVQNTLMDMSKNLPETNSQYEYDVPKISFSFFDLTSNPQEEEEVAKDANQPKHKSEIVIVLAEPETNKEIEEEYQKDTSVDEATIDICITKSLENFPLRLMKCGSDPNICMRRAKSEVDEDEEALYKVPRSLKRNRLSQSLNDFDIDNIETINSTHSSIEHISCSQVNIQKPEDNSVKNSRNSESMDYCKTRSRLPMKFRRVTLLRKPKSKAVDTWTNFRTKFSNLMTEQAAQQRVGAFDNKDRSPIKIEEIYRNSKDKCKKVLKNTGKLFKKNPRNEEGSETSSQIVKNHAFFAKVNLKASDIEYKLNYSISEDKTDEKEEVIEKNEGDGCESPGCKEIQTISRSVSEEKKEEFDFNTIKSAFRRSRAYTEGQNGFEDLRRYVKHGSDFCKELSTILQERSEAEIQYAKSLSKLSNKLSKACREGVGDLNEAWRAVAVELEARAEGHRIVGAALLEEAARPLRTLTENQHRLRKQTETTVDKAARNLADWRGAEAKGKKHSHTCARENEKLQDALIDAKYGKMTLSRSTSLIHLTPIHSKPTTDKENAKLEGKKRKAENAVKKADIEYYTLCVRAERARLEWESAVLRGSGTFQSLEEERLNNLKSVLASYLKLSNEICPRLVEAADRLKAPINEADPSRDLCTFVSLRQSSHQIAEQLLPDFYCEHITLAMNKERRKQALVKLIHLIRQDIERERKSKNGLENLSIAIKQNPSFGVEDSQQSVAEKLYHMKSMLTYLEGARYKVQSALAELDSRPRNGHPLAPHITITRDKSGLQQSILKVPQWLRDGWIEPETSPLSEKSDKSDVQYHEELTEPDWNDRGAGDGNSNQPDSDFDEFSSQSSTSDDQNTEDKTMQPVAQCRALYTYTPNLPDELTLKPGDLLSVYRQQEDGWWLGECNGSVGIFPATYVETIS